jgi:Major tropism determinant N-terminal domain
MTQYLTKLIARTGLAAAIPVLDRGELGYDTDTKTLRVGDGSAVPLKVLTTGSTSVYDFSTADVTYGDIKLKTIAGKVGGVTINKLNATDGLLARFGPDGIHSTVIMSGDSSLTITGGDGSGGVVDIRWVSSPAAYQSLADNLISYLGISMTTWPSAVNVQDAFGTHVYYAFP